MHKTTVNGEKFAGLNIHSFSPMEFFVGILSWCLGQKCLLFNITKYSQENFRGTLKNCENRGSLAQQIFPRLRYVYGSLLVVDLC